MQECFDAWEEAACPRLPKLHIPQLQFVIKLRLTEVTTGRASEEERQKLLQTIRGNRYRYGGGGGGLGAKTKD